MTATTRKSERCVTPPGPVDRFLQRREGPGTNNEKFMLWSPVVGPLESFIPYA